MQKVGGNYNVLYRLLLSMPALLLALTAGSWVDRFNRRVPIIVVSLVNIAAAGILIIGNAAGVNYFLVLAMVSGLLRGCVGNVALVSMSVHSYITDITFEENRTSRIACLTAMNCLGLCTGYFISGVIVDYLGYGAAYGMSTLFSVLILVATPLMRCRKYAESDGSSEDQESILNMIKNSVSVLTQKRQNDGRAKLLILFITLIVCSSSLVHVYLATSPNVT